MTMIIDSNPAPIGIRMPRMPGDFSWMEDAVRRVRAAMGKRRAYDRVQRMSDFHLRDIGLDPADVRRHDIYRPTINPYAF